MFKWCKPPHTTPLLPPALVSVQGRLSVCQEGDRSRETEGTVCWKERERIRKRCMDRRVRSGSSQPWWRRMAGWGDKSSEGAGEVAFARCCARWKAGKIDGERGCGKVNQGSTERMSAEHASVTKWRGERRGAGAEECGKERFMERGN